MPILELTDDQVVQLVKQLPPDRKRAALLALAVSGEGQREERLERAEERLRKISAQRGLAWESLSAEERENLIDDLVHEDRQCGP